MTYVNIVTLFWQGLIGVKMALQFSYESSRRWQELIETFWSGEGVKK